MNLALYTWCTFMFALNWAAELDDQPQAELELNFMSEYKAFIRQRITDIISSQNGSAVDTSSGRPVGVQPVKSNGAEVVERSSVTHAVRIEMYFEPEASNNISFPGLLYAVPGALISSSHVLTSALLIDVLKEFATLFGSTLSCSIVLGDLRSDKAESGEQVIPVSLSSIIYHPSYTKPEDDQRVRLTKNNLAVIPLGSALTSNTDASPIPIEIGLPESLAGYTLDLIGWETVNNAEAWFMSRTTLTGDKCQVYAIGNTTEVYSPNPDFTSCYSNKAASGGCPILTDAFFSDIGAPVTTTVPKSSIFKQQALVSVNQYTDCSGKLAFGSSVSYPSHADFVCQYATKCYYQGKISKRATLMAGNVLNNIGNAILNFFTRG